MQQVTVTGKVVIAGVTAIVAIAVAYTISLGATIDYYTQVFTDTSGDSMMVTWGPTSDGTTTYNDGSGNQTINGWLVSTLADGEQGFHGANTQLVRISILDFATPVNTRIVSVNGLNGYGGSGAYDTPPGWWGMGTSGGPGDPGLRSSFHVIGGVSISGYRFFIQQRNDGSGTGDLGMLMFPPDDTSPYAHGINAYHAFKDTISTQGCASNVITLALGTTHTLNAGDDVWIHGANTNNGVFTLASATHSPEVVTYPATCANVSPTASAGYVSFADTGGDPVQCNAPGPGTNCTYIGYTAGMMWRGTEAPKMQNIKPVVYGQDGTGTGPDGSGTWDYWISYNGYQYLHRVARTNTTGASGGWQNASNWTHYNDHGGGCAVTNPANWDSLSANSTPIIPGLAIDVGQNQGPIIYKGGVYYMLVNLYGGHGGWTVDEIGLYTAPSPCGPWTISAHTPVPGGDYQTLGFPTFMFPLIFNQSSTQFTVPMMADNNVYPGHPAAGSPIFTLMTITHP